MNHRQLFKRIHRKTRQSIQLTTQKLKHQYTVLSQQELHRVSLLKSSFMTKDVSEPVKHVLGVLRGVSFREVISVCFQHDYQF